MAVLLGWEQEQKQEQEALEPPDDECKRPAGSAHYWFTTTVGSAEYQGIYCIIAD